MSSNTTNNDNNEDFDPSEEDLDEVDSAFSDVEAEFDDAQLTCLPETESRMSSLIRIQDELNRKFVGEDWIQIAEVHGTIDYCPAMLDEAAELMRSCGKWKFWKKGVQEDLANMRLEFIDILHFALSEGMASKQSRNNLHLKMGFWFEDVYLNEFNDGEKPRYDYFLMKKNLFAFLSSVFSVHLEYEQSLISEEDEFSVELVENDIDWKSFWSIPFYMGMSFEDVYSTYISKVALNQFRILKGDKAGTYQKYWWEKEEDNFYLMSKVSSLKGEDGSFTASIDDIFQWLNVTYQDFLEGRPFKL